MSHSVLLCIHLTIVILLLHAGFVPVSISQQDIRVLPDGASSDHRCQQQLCFVLMGQEETASLRNKLQAWGVRSLTSERSGAEPHSTLWTSTADSAQLSLFLIRSNRFAILSKQTAFFKYFCLWLPEPEKKSMPVMKWSYVSVMLWIAGERHTVMIHSAHRWNNDRYDCAAWKSKIINSF